MVDGNCATVVSTCGKLNAGPVNKRSHLQERLGRVVNGVQDLLGQLTGLLPKPELGDNHCRSNYERLE